MEQVIKFLLGSKVQATLTVFYFAVICWLLYKIYRCGCCNAVTAEITGANGTTSKVTLTGGSTNTLPPSNSGGGSTTYVPTTTAGGGSTSTNCNCSGYANTESFAKATKCTINGQTKSIWDWFQEISTAWGGGGNQMQYIKPDNNGTSIFGLCGEDNQFSVTITVPISSNLTGLTGYAQSVTTSNVQVYKVTLKGCCAGLEWFIKWRNQNTSLYNLGGIPVNLGTIS